MILLNGKEIKPQNFPNGERVFNYDDFQLYRSNPNFVELKINGMEDLTTLYFIMNLMPKDFQYILIARYIPFSRFDIDNNEDLFMLKAMTKMINDMNFVEVWTDEPISNVVLGMIDRIVPSYSTKDILDELVNDGKIENPVVVFDWKNYSRYKTIFDGYDIASIYAEKNKDNEYVAAFNSFLTEDLDDRDYVLVVPYLSDDTEYDKMIQSCIKGILNMTTKKINIVAGTIDTSLNQYEGQIKIYTKNVITSVYNNEIVEVVENKKDEESD